MYIFSKAVHTTNSQWTPSFDDYQREINTYPPLWKPSGMRQRDFGGFSYFELFIDVFCKHCYDNRIFSVYKQ